MKKIARRLLTSALATALAAGLCITASAFTYPSNYWPLQDSWIAATEAQNADQVISVAQQTYDLLIPYGLNQDVCYNLEPKCGLASWACEIKGDLDGAILWLQRQLELDQWLDANVGNYHDSIINNEARMDYLVAARDVTVYAQSNDDASPYSVGPAHGTWYGTPADNPNGTGSATLIYMEFGESYGADYWIDYYAQTSDQFREAMDGGVIEVAWNFSPSTAGCQQVLSADSYINETLSALGSLDATVLLRAGAEMNNWAECDPATFIQAFQKIATAARRYDNIQMVFSPDNINNRTVTAADYYPGDAYVDWVGMSVYHRTNYAGYGNQPSEYSMGNNTYGNNAYYGQGIYDYDPLVSIQHIVELARAHGKPVMISECGFAYWNGSQDTTNYAVDQLTKFYSYVNMLYPEVKAVFYFDIPREVETYHYGLNGNATLKSAYTAAVANNGAYLDEVDGTATGWENLSQTQLTETGTLKLATYASFPGVQNATVQYYVDGNLAATSTQAPYYYELNTAALGAGDHSIYVVASGNQFSRTSATYTLTVPGAAEPEPEPQPEPTTGFSDVAADAWYAAPVTWAVENDITAGITPTTFGPDNTCTRSQIITFLYAAAGRPAGASDNPFGDVQEGDWFYDATAWAAANDVEDGDAFAPNDPCTRAMAMEFIWRALGCPEASVTENLFTDVDEDASYYEAVLWALGEGVTSGTSETTFGSDNTCTRSQIVTFLYQAFN